jgi:hypothetical protein
MLGRRLPFTSIHATRCNMKLQELMTSCWDADPDRRPAAAEVGRELAGMLDACSRVGVPASVLRGFPNENGAGTERNKAHGDQPRSVAPRRRWLLCTNTGSMQRCTSRGLQHVCSRPRRLGTARRLKPRAQKSARLLLELARRRRQQPGRTVHE